jgi:hypothetical protein
MSEMLEKVGFAVREVVAVGEDGQSAMGSRVYGWLINAEVPGNVEATRSPPRTLARG